MCWRRVIPLLVLLMLLLVPEAPCRLEIGIVQAYRQVGSPVARLFTTCRFEPTCSTYAIESLRKRGFWKGNFLLARRLALCSPLGP